MAKKKAKRKTSPKSVHRAKEDAKRTLRKEAATESRAIEANRPWWPKPGYRTEEEKRRARASDWGVPGTVNASYRKKKK